jgi:hypothetical protein
MEAGSRDAPPGAGTMCQFSDIVRVSAEKVRQETPKVLSKILDQLESSSAQIWWFFPPISAFQHDVRLHAQLLSSSDLQQVSYRNLEIKNTYNCSHINKVQGKSTVKELT